jgi:LmbE family N-acetylglucosaminyl deacetylase
MARTLVIAAHPDDESLGAASLLTSLESCGVLHLTDGAPRDPRLWPACALATPGAYARQRQDEARRALALAGVQDEDVHRLGGVELELSYSMGELARELCYWFLALKPELVVTHAYEGGHPDNDAAAFAVAAACDLVGRTGHRPPLQLEMALYHGATGHLAIGEFVSSGADTPPQIECAFTATALRRKHDMLRCFESQADALRPFFSLTRERFRPAPHYDFCQPPHRGPLLYEQIGEAMTGAEWRVRAAQARAELGPPAVILRPDERDDRAASDG